GSLVTRAVILHVGLPVVVTVGDLGDGVPDDALGVLLDLPHEGLQRFGPVLGRQLAYALLTRPAGGDLRVEVGNRLLRNPDVGAEELAEGRLLPPLSQVHL